MGPLEIAANGFNLISVFLARKNSVHTWWIGVIACVLMGVMFFQVQLYADVILQIFFVGTSLLGWWNWIYGGDRASQAKTELAVTHIRWPKLLLIIAGSGLLTGLHGFLLYQFTDASYPFIDSLVLMLSVAAQFLLIGRRVESWYLWILVDLIAVPLFYSKDLKLTAAVYFLFLLNAIWGLWTWRRLAVTPPGAA